MDKTTSELEETARMISELAAVPDSRDLTEAVYAEQRRTSEASTRISAEIAAIESKRGSFAASTGPTWLPQEEEKRLAQVKRELTELHAESTKICQQLRSKMVQAEQTRVLLEERLFTRTTGYYTQKRVADEAALQRALTDARNSVGDLDNSTATSLWRSLAAAQALVYFDAKQAALSEQRTLERDLGLTVLPMPNPNRWGDALLSSLVNRHAVVSHLLIQRCECRDGNYHRNDCTGCPTTKDRLNRELVDLSLKLAKARWELKEKISQDEQALSHLQLAHRNEIAELQRAWEAARAASAEAERLAEAERAAPLRHAAAATVAYAADALRTASSACSGALDACTAEADSYAPAVARARAKLEAVERQQNAALAARQRVEQGMSAVTAALENAEGMAREVSTLVNERDAARAKATALQGELERTCEAHALQQSNQGSEMQRERASLTAACAASEARASRLETLFRGAGEAQAAVMAALSLEELAALSSDLRRTLDAATSETTARAVRAATERFSAQAATCVVCQDSPKTTVLLPCGHKCVCAACAATVQLAGTGTCPICRAMITGSVVPFD